MRRGKRSAGYRPGNKALLAFFLITLSTFCLASGWFFAQRFALPFVGQNDAPIMLAEGKFNPEGDRSGKFYDLVNKNSTFFDDAEEIPSSGSGDDASDPGAPDIGLPDQTTRPPDEAGVPDINDLGEPQENEHRDQNPERPPEENNAAEPSPPDNPAAEPEEMADPNLPVVNEYGIYSKNALLLDLQTGESLFALKENEVVYPASLSKIMTALVALERLEMEEKVTITAGMLNGLKEASASLAGFTEGETVTVRDLLHGVMLPSGADAANAVAVAAFGSVSAFVDEMNRKASELGMQSTHFVNTHGLHDPKLVSTVSDLSVLLRHALQNNTFRKIFTTGSYVTTPTEQHPQGIHLSNYMTKAITEAENPLSGGRITGNKTGFTTPAGQCLASLAEIGGREYILVTVGAGKSGYNKQRYNMLDAWTLYGRIEV